ncbi:hypothetical protein [Streptomyces sp. NBC_01217]|uniref:hypothetical protein n=1 Tax=Streptomyces sp. NBC_01217 TaxID=2903779 RepID=UPI002E0E1269|nr:hypothetical protein OG507_34685 [Streptomyces sp. NBC_01217]
MKIALRARFVTFTLAAAFVVAVLPGVTQVAQAASAEPTSCGDNAGSAGFQRPASDAEGARRHGVVADRAEQPRRLPLRLVERLQAVRGAGGGASSAAYDADDVPSTGVTTSAARVMGPPFMTKAAKIAAGDQLVGSAPLIRSRRTPGRGTYRGTSNCRCS